MTVNKLEQLETAPHRFPTGEAWMEYYKTRLSDKQLLALSSVFEQCLEGAELVSDVNVNGKVTTTITTRTPELEITVVLHH
jgi:hypothetical protein